ncbi:MAG: hypothetical protein HY659_02565 [Rhizobiales bacterium]|nr:hypothetical protein [Hyphomicrobiales bacterium]
MKLAPLSAAVAALSLAVITAAGAQNVYITQPPYAEPAYIPEPAYISPDAVAVPAKTYVVSEPTYVIIEPSYVAPNYVQPGYSYMSDVPAASGAIYPGYTGIVYCTTDTDGHRHCQ